MGGLVAQKLHNYCEETEHKLNIYNVLGIYNFEHRQVTKTESKGSSDAKL